MIEFHYKRETVMANYTIFTRGNMKLKVEIYDDDTSVLEFTGERDRQVVFQDRRWSMKTDPKAHEFRTFLMELRYCLDPAMSNNYNANMASGADGRRGRW